MKRHPALVPLSEEHQHALALAHRIKLSVKETGKAAALAAEVGVFWEKSLAAHFRAEEEHLFPEAETAVRGNDGSGVMAEVKALLGEHGELRRLVEAIQKDADAMAENLEKFAVRLHDHVRREERVFFPMAEAALSEEALARVGEALRRRKP